MVPPRATRRIYAIEVASLVLDEEKSLWRMKRQITANVGTGADHPGRGCPLGGQSDSTAAEGDDDTGIGETAAGRVRRDAHADMLLYLLAAALLEALEQADPAHPGKTAAAAAHHPVPLMDRHVVPARESVATMPKPTRRPGSARRPRPCQPGRRVLIRAHRIAHRVGRRSP